jgi:plastocyanin
MKRIVLLATAVLAVAGLTQAATARPAANATVLITATGFNPDTVVIDEGDTVTWKNADTADHQIVSDEPTIRSPVLNTGESYSHRFPTADTIFYHDGKKPSESGLVQVQGPDTSVTLTTSDDGILYGTSVRLLGGIGVSRAGESVTIHVVPYFGAQSTRTVTTDADGLFQAAFRPKIRTDYYATWKSSRSAKTPRVHVRPFVAFRVVNAQRNYYFVRVTAMRSFKGKIVRIQRRSSKGLWVTMKRVRLNRLSRAFFYGTFPRGRTLARAQVARAPGYFQGFSSTKTIVR